MAIRRIWCSGRSGRASLALMLALVPEGGARPPAPDGGQDGAGAAAAVDRAVEQGLSWLARQQLATGCFAGAVGHKQGDGYVLLDPTRQGVEGEGHVGVTALAGLAFLADGHVPERGRHRAALDGVIAYLARCCSEVGFISANGSRMYSHAFATLFLSQVYGMAGRRGAEVEATLRRAVAFIEATQNETGGWRYSPFTTETDLSVTVCQVQALRAARNVGIHVSRSCIDRVTDYVRQSRIESGRWQGAFYYKISGRAAFTKTSFAINAAAATTLHSAGLYDEALYGRALDFLEQEYDEISTYYPDHFYFWYGNYYAAQALNQEGGRRYQRYRERLEADLLARQQPDGRWRNAVGPGDGFATAVACLLLRLPAGFLPIFQR